MRLFEMSPEGLAEFGFGGVKRVLLGKIEPGQDLLSALERIAEEEGIEGGVILSVIGSLRRAVLRNVARYPEELPVTDAQRLYKEVEGPLEILSVSGTISRQDGGIFIHAHICVSKVVDGEVAVMGGHLTQGCITWVNVEFALAEIEGMEMRRMLHEERRTSELLIFPQKNLGST